VKAVLKALHEASVWADKLENRAELAQTVSRPAYINCPPEVIQADSRGTTTTGWSQAAGSELHDLLRAELQLPTDQVRRLVPESVSPLGMVEAAPDYAGIAKRVMRATSTPRP